MICFDLKGTLPQWASVKLIIINLEKIEFLIVNTFSPEQFKKTPYKRPEY